MRQKQNLKGKQFGKLTVVDEAPYHKNDFAPYWWCQCECGNRTSVRAYHLTKGITKSCGGLVHRTGTSHYHWSGHGEISGTFFGFLKKGAKYRSIPFKLSKEYIWELYVKQKQRCALSNIKLTFDSQRTKNDGTASLDRIDSSKGYIEGNVQWVHKDVNFMKGELVQKNFINWCKLISKNNK